jgi:uncharacterized protein YqjF (DUF2071 family)
MSFLKAEWRKLIMVNYLVDPNVLKPYLPAHTELDLFQGKCFVSFVGFLFKNTKVKGIRFPFHVNFEEINLRFYVTHNVTSGTKRGVVFIKEIVPKPIISFVANHFYKEHYETLKMDYSWVKNTEDQEITYGCFQKKWHKISVKAQNELLEIPKNSETEFITEHYWGYSQHKKNTVEYEVRHPRWQQYKVIETNIDVDFELLYGPNFSFLNHTPIHSVILAEGSEISIEKLLHQLFISFLNL